MPDLRSIAALAIPTLALGAGAGACVLGVQVVQRLGHLEGRLAPPPAAQTEVAPATSALGALRAADEAALAGRLRVAAGLYEEAVAAADATEADRAAARLGLARAALLLGDRDRSSAALAAAAAPPERQSLATRLAGWGEAALAAQAWSDARRLFWSALAVEDGPLDEPGRLGIHRALARIADAHRLEAGLGRTRTVIVDLTDAPPWAAQLAAIDSGVVPIVALSGERLSVRAERADAVQLLRAVALQAGVPLAAPAAAPPGGVTVDLHERPVDEVLQILAGAAGLELVQAGEGRSLAPILPPVDAAGREAARARASATYRLAIGRGGPEAARAQVELADLARIGDRHEEAVGLYRSVTLGRVAAPEVMARALLGLARSEASLLRFARAREALFRLVSNKESGKEAKSLAPDALLLVAETFLAEGRDADAEATLHHLLKTFGEEPQAATAQLQLARILAARGASADALAAFEAAGKAGGVDVVEAGVGSCKALLALDRPQEAATSLRALLARTAEARSAANYLLLADCHHAAGDHMAAWMCLEHVARTHAATAEAEEAARRVPRELVELGLLEQAGEAVRQAPASDPAEKDAERRLLLAEAWLETGDVARARLVAQRGAPEPALTLLLVRCDLLQGDVAAAAARLERVDPKLLDPQLRAARERLAVDVALARGSLDEARGASTPHPAGGGK